MAAPFRLIALSAAVTTGIAWTATAQEGGITGREDDRNADLANWRYEPLYAGWRAERLLDAEVYGAGGEEIGDVEDIVVTPDGRVDRVIVEAGGFADLGETHFGVPWSEVEMRNADSVTVPVDEDNVDEFSLFGDDGDTPAQGRAWRATEFIGDHAFFAEGMRFGLVDDLIFDDGGRLQAVVVAAGGGSSGPYALPYRGTDDWDPTMEVYEAPYTLDQAAELGPFDVGRMDGEAPAADDPS